MTGAASKVNVLILAASLRGESLNRKLAELAAGIAQEPDRLDLTLATAAIRWPAWTVAVCVALARGDQPKVSERTDDDDNR